MLPAARDHFKDHVRARGHFPALRIGRQPYGVLPVIWSAHWKSLEGRPLDAPLISLLGRLARHLGKLGAERAAAAGRRRSRGSAGERAGHEPDIDQLRRAQRDRAGVQSFVLEIRAAGHRSDVVERAGGEVAAEHGDLAATMADDAAGERDLRQARTVR